jgi:glycosyltransferase involved in cell wall biosynthesis
MPLLLLDPNLDREHGHHLEWDLAIARAAQARGEGVRIIAHRDFPSDNAAGIPVLPWFTFTTYGTASSDPVTGRYDDFRLFNEALAADLATLPPDTLRTGDAVLAPTLNENHLLGYATWMKGFDAARAPLFLLHLLFPAGQGSGPGDPLTALFYRLGLRKAEEPGAEIHLFGAGAQIARDFTAMLGRPVAPYPVPLAPRRSGPRPAGARPACLLFVGDAKPDKGVLLLPALAEALAAAHPGWDFVIHANRATAWGPAATALQDLAAIAARRGNIHLHTARLDRPAYEALLESADALLCTHDPAGYAAKSSGVVWEAISLGVPLIVPRDTWLSREAEEWNAGALTVPAHSPEALAAAFDGFLAERERLGAASAAAAGRFHAVNGADRLIEQIWSLWRPTLPARAVPPPVTPGGAVPEGAGTAHWLGHDAELTFPWPAGEAWQIEIAAARRIAPEQVEVTSDAETPGRVTILSDGRDHRGGQIRLRVSLARPSLRPPASTTLAAAADEPDAFRSGAVRAARVRLDELLPGSGEEYRHLDLSLHGLATPEHAWSHVKLKLCRMGEARHLEFRRMPGWPAMFEAWPGTQTDRYGELLRIPADSGPPPARTARDRALLDTLSRCLKDAVIALRDGDPERAEILEAWISEAELHQRSLAAGLRRLEATG